MKIALVHDHLNQWGGAENVFLAMTEIFPQADLFTLMFDAESVHPGFKYARVTSSFIARLPLAHKLFEWYLPIMPQAVEHLDLSEYDVVISSDSSFAKGVITAPQAIHICYCHTPARFLWNYAQGYTDELRKPNVVKKLLPLFLTRLRMWDYQAAQRVDFFIANSQVVKHRIKKYYNRDSYVLHPAIEPQNFAPSHVTKDYFLAMGRFRPYKRFDIAIEAFNKLAMPLKIIGTGADEKRLRALAGPTIEFVGRVNDATRKKLLAECRAFLHPQEEDFGITVLEAMASGRPVIAYDGGGARETVIPQVTGVLFDKQDWETLATTIITFDETVFDQAKIRAHATTFSMEKFKATLDDYIHTLLVNHHNYENRD